MKIFDKPSIEVWCIVSEAITDDDLTDMEGGFGSGLAPDD